ncbi:MAG: hypothetical protein LBG73_09270 [Spirochaetaceae bacterium]|jgi:hypothetical protein|nr:hypothetical protein [Spirochaetaceae bacterium]
MAQTLDLKGNEFYAVQDLFEDLLAVPQDWNIGIGEAVQVRVLKNPKKARVKVKGEILSLRFTLTINKNSAFLITDQECRSIETFVYDIVTILRGALNKPVPDIAPLGEAEAQEWVKRCIPPSKPYKNLILSLKGLAKSGVYNETGWTTGRYKMLIKRPQDNDPLLNAFIDLYGGAKVVAFSMQEMGRPPFYLVARDDLLYYDSDRVAYFEAVLEDLERIISKIARGSFKEQSNVNSASG